MLSLVAAIKATAERNVAAPALITGSRIITYKELLDLIARIGNALVGRGLAPLAKVFINIADPDLRLATMIAAMHCGLVPYLLLEIGDLKDDVDYDLVVGTPERFVPDPAPDLVLDQNTLSGPLSDGRLREFPDRGDEDILYVATTGGTTGRRKLVAEMYGGFKNRVSPRMSGSATLPEGARPLRNRVLASDRVMATAGDVTTSGNAQAFRALSAGAAHVRFDRNLPQCLRLINILAVTWLVTTPATVADLMDHMEAERIRCPSIRRINLVGSLFPKALVERLERNFEAALSVSYGTSETGPISGGPIAAATFETGYVGELDPHVTLISAGSRLEPRSLVVLSRRGDRLPYYSAGKLSSDRREMFSLPDLGFVEGIKLFLVGRDDEVFNFSGNKTAYSVIEGALRELPGVKDVGIVSGSAIGDVEGLVVAVVSAGETSLEDFVACICRAVGVARAREHIHLFAMEKIPRTSMGKVDRGAIVRAYRSA